MANPEKPEDDEEQLVAKEMFDATYEHVDVVKGPAHGMRFVVLKAGEKQDPAAIAAITSSTANSAATGGPLEVTPVSKATEETIATEPQPVAKADTTLDAGEVLAAADKGDPTEAAEEPGSPAWEAVDAATARKWTAILSRSKNALSVMADRENIEVAMGADNGDPSDLDSVFNLVDAASAIDYSISQLAKFAADEQAEVDTSQALDGVAKAMVGFKTEDLDVIESLGPVKKAGRVLSASNEAAIRGAVESLQKVLASLPAAPEDVTKSKEVIVKVEPIQLVKKAKGDPMVPLYDATGKLCGMVDAEDVVPIAAAPGADKEPAPAPAENPDAPPPDASAAGETTEPATPVAASAAPNAAPAEDEAANQTVAKSQSSQNIAELVQSAVDTAVKAESEEHQKVIKDLKARLEIVEKQPASGGPLLGGLALGGMTPTSGGHLALRGQEPENDSPEIVRIKKALEGTKDPVQQAQLSRELSFHQMRERLGGQPK